MRWLIGFTLLVAACNTGYGGLSTPRFVADGEVVSRYCQQTGDRDVQGNIIGRADRVALAGEPTQLVQRHRLIELRVVGHASSGTPRTVEMGAVEWNAKPDASSDSLSRTTTPSRPRAGQLIAASTSE